MALALNTSHPLYSSLKMLLAVDTDGVVKDLVTPSRVITKDNLCVIGSGTYGRHFETVANGAYNFYGLTLGTAFTQSTAAPGAAVFVVTNGMVSSSQFSSLFGGAGSGGLFPWYTHGTGKVQHYHLSASAVSVESTASIAIGAHSFMIARNDDTAHKTYIDGVLDNAGAQGPGSKGTLSVTTVGGNAGFGSIGGKFVYIAVFSGYPTDAEAEELHSSLIGGNTFSMVTGADTGGDTTAPALNGAITASAINNSGFTISWPAGTDDVAVTGYEYSTNGGSSYTAVGNVLTANVTGLAASTSYAVRVRAFDAAANKSTSLAATVTTSAPPADTTAPTQPGTPTASAITETSFTLNWTGSTDAVGVTGYEYSTDAGTSYASVGLALTANVTGRTPGTTYQVRVRAFDAAGNRSTASAATVTTTAATTRTVSLTLVNATGVPRANLTGLRWAFFDQATPDAMMAPIAKGAGATTSASGVLQVTVTGTALSAGNIGWLVVSDSDGTTAQASKAFSAPVLVS